MNIERTTKESFGIYTCEISNGIDGIKKYNINVTENG